MNRMPFGLAEEQHTQNNPVVDSESLRETDTIDEQHQVDLDPEPEEPPEVRRSFRPRRAPKWLQELKRRGRRPGKAVYQLILSC